MHGAVLKEHEGATLGSHRLHFEVPDVLVLAAWAALGETIAMKLCQLLSGDARPQVQVVDVLTDDVRDLALCRQSCNGLPIEIAS